MTESDIKLGKLYRHYKTRGLYIPLQVIKNTGDGMNDKLMVLYYSFQAATLFTRPLEEFVAKVEVALPSPAGSGKMFTPRFELVSPQV